MLRERCGEPISDKITVISLGDVLKNTISGSFGPLEGFFGRKSLGRVKRSDLVQSGRNTSLGVVMALCRAH